MKDIEFPDEVYVFVEPVKQRFGKTKMVLRVSASLEALGTTHGRDVAVYLRTRQVRVRRSVAVSEKGESK